MNLNGDDFIMAYGTKFVLDSSIGFGPNSNGELVELRGNRFERFFFFLVILSFRKFNFGYITF